MALTMGDNRHRTQGGNAVKDTLETTQSVEIDGYATPHLMENLEIEESNQGKNSSSSNNIGKGQGVSSGILLGDSNGLEKADNRKDLSLGKESSNELLEPPGFERGSQGRRPIEHNPEAEDTIVKDTNLDSDSCQYSSFQSRDTEESTQEVINFASIIGVKFKGRRQDTVAALVEYTRLEKSTNKSKKKKKKKDIH